DDLTPVIETLRPWGDFQLPATDELGDLRFWFYVLPHHERKRLNELQLPWRIVANDRQNVYVVVLSTDEPDLGNHKPVDLDERRLSDLQQRLNQVRAQLRELHGRRIQLTRWCTL